MIPLSTATKKRIAILFPEGEQSVVSELLEIECGDNLPMVQPNYTQLAERIRFAVLRLSQENVAQLRASIADAKLDWRDTLMMAGFSEDVNAHLSWMPDPPPAILAEGEVSADAQNSRSPIRTLLITLLTLACSLGGYRLFGILGVTLIVLLIGVCLIVRGRRSRRRGVAWTGIALTTLAVSIAILRLVGWMIFGIGPIYSVAARPHEFKSMVEFAQAQTGDAQIAGLGSFIDNSHVWRLSLSPDQVDRVVAEYELEELAADGVPDAFWGVFPYWWRPEPDANNHYYSSPSFPAEHRGVDGDHCMAMYDSENEKFYVWYKSNF